MNNLKKHRRQIFYSLFLSFASFYFACERNTTPFTQTPAQLNLSAEYVAVTEAWLQVQTQNVSGEHQLKVWRDTTIVFNDILTTTDTTVYDSTLLPAHDYTYHAAIVKNGNNVVVSQPLKIATMDTTSHEFTWEIFTFGSGASSILHDVAIISPDNIWAVGDINASGGPYNAVHWDGQQWELKRIKTLACGGVDYPPIIAIFAFSSNDILFAHIDGSITHYNGNNFINDCSLINQLNGSVNKMWGTSRNDLYVVSGNGFIAHYGSSWQKIESGTELPIQDIWGAKNEDSGEYEILCVASDKYHNFGKKILGIEENNIITIEDAGLPWSLSAIWFIPQRRYYICGDGVYSLSDLNNQWKLDNSHPLLYKHAIRGQAVNDVMIAGSFGLLSHFNGAGWKHYQESQFPQAAYRAVAIKHNVVAAAGYLGGQAFIIIGQRN